MAGCYGTVTCHKKYVFGFYPSFWHRAPKTLGISPSDKGAFCFVNEVTLGKSLSHLRIGADWENQPCD